MGLRADKDPLLGMFLLRCWPDIPFSSWSHCSFANLSCVCGVYLFRSPGPQVTSSSFAFTVSLAAGLVST